MEQSMNLIILKERLPSTLDAGCMSYKTSILKGIFRKKKRKFTLLLPF